MQILKEEVKLEILKASKELFLQEGFRGATLNMIAQKAKISKSNLYNYFPSKEEIFYYLTDGANVQIESMFNTILEHESDEAFNPEEFIELMSNQLIELLTNYKEEVLLVVDCSEGTKFQNTKDAIIDRLQEHCLNEFKKFNIIMENSDHFFVHYISASLVEGLLEIIRHNKSDSWIKSNIKLLIGYFINGYSYFFKDSWH